LVHRPQKEQLIRLYRSAEGLVYPSLYEGFGLPPLEAMASGCPVAASTGGSIPEIVGNAAVLFDPRDTEALLQSMKRLLDPFVADRLRKTAAERIQLFNWDRVAAQTLEVYRKTAHT
jgi:glycosyltransferase involved in cell wall biosynthesis